MNCRRSAFEWLQQAFLDPMHSRRREMGRLYHAKGVERLVRNELWKGRTPERFYDALEWLYGWKVENCLAS
jgi:hypothetical protein